MGPLERQVDWGHVYRVTDGLGRERQRRPSRGQRAGQMGRGVQGGTGEASKGGVSLKARG